MTANVSLKEWQSLLKREKELIEETENRDDETYEQTTIQRPCGSGAEQA